MPKTRRFGILKSVVLSCIVIVTTNEISGQSVAPAKPSIVSETLPIMSQLKESVVFLETQCEHIPADTNDKGKIDRFVGTGFLVFYPDTRLGPMGGFSYLVTNRHVALPGIEKDRPCTVVSRSISVNLKATDATHPSHSQILDLDKHIGWLFPEDPSVDLAIMPLGLDQATYEYKTLPTDLFATNEVMKAQAVVEGDRVFFAGLFLQFLPYLNQSRLEPVVRSGSIALIPGEKIPTVLHGLPGMVYLAEAHAFGGNSGSPVFVDVGGNREHGTPNAIDYRVLGVVSGEVFETEDLQLEVTIPSRVSGKANSGLSIIVPAQQILDLLNSTTLLKFRDKAIASRKP